MKVLEHYKVPGGLVNFFRAQYDNVVSYIQVGGEVMFFCSIASGAIQGDPAAAILFTRCMDSALWLLHWKVENPGRGLVGGCADDVGVVIR
eukprot:12400670-Karenia_brevis.AAC.1